VHITTVSVIGIQSQTILKVHIMTMLTFRTHKHSCIHCYNDDFTTTHRPTTCLCTYLTWRIYAVA